MSRPKLGKSTINEPVHYSVGAVVISGRGEYLLIDRVKPPFGFAGIAGHIDEGEEPLAALPREIQEESGLSLKNFKFLIEKEVVGNKCSRGINIHYWYLFACTVEGKIKHNPKEVKQIGWYSAHQIQQMADEGKLELVWKYWFRKLGIIK